MTTATLRAGATAPGAAMPRRPRRGSLILTVILVVGAAYCLSPLVWVVMASTKSPQELFSTFTLAPGTGFLSNLEKLFTMQNGVFLSWIGNTIVYSLGGSVLCVLVSALAGYALAKFRFPGRDTMFRILLGGVLIPGIALAIPQYFVMAGLGLTNTYWAVLLPMVISPFSIFLCRVYATSSVSSDLLEAARIDGAGEFSIFRRIALPIMVPGLVTVFLLHFIGTWNNFLLPYLMLSNERLYPLTLGLFTLLSTGDGKELLYTTAIVGAFVSLIPLVALMLFLQRFWKLDLISGGLKG
ncbi:carbohydrate ABC transporter permease [Plantibacter sp. MCCC 1A11337]|uniref:carbohydrate ABC transporter permease n=1 Tax=Plantibacter sp. MCCC 1A11337 TaxID=2736644 RepID=UPI001581AD11|nr:carbohydrate ABC transporter permease [Plantibacter sp. MCCC 1A11337]NUJ88389.1 carbohydrate ABC transporter permease [Plantibacter sp. MCCC 1A11337]